MKLDIQNVWVSIPMELLQYQERTVDSLNIFYLFIYLFTHLPTYLPTYLLIVYLFNIYCLVIYVSINAFFHVFIYSLLMVYLTTLSVVYSM
jgi:hypothetical protein